MLVDVLDSGAARLAAGGAAGGAAHADENAQQLEHAPHAHHLDDDGARLAERRDDA